MKNTIETRKQYLVKFAGEKGANRTVNIFGSVDGPSYENLNSMLEAAELNGMSDEMFEVIEDACKIVKKEILEAEEHLNELAETELGIKEHKSLYSVVLDAFKYSENRCESVLITRVVTAKKKVLCLKEVETIDKFEVLAFDERGNMLGHCDVEEPLEVTVDQLLDVIKFSEKSKKSVVKRDIRTRTITLPEEVAGVKVKVDKSRDDKYETRGRKSSKVGHTSIEKKKVVIAAVAVGVCVFAVGAKVVSLNSQVKKLTQVENAYNNIMSVLNDEAKANINYIVELEEAAKKLGLKFDLEKKAFVDTAGGK